MYMHIHNKQQQPHHVTHDFAITGACAERGRNRNNSSIWSHHNTKFATGRGVVGGIHPCVWISLSLHGGDGSVSDPYT